MFCKLHSGIWKPVIIQSFYCSKIYDRNPWVSLRETVSFHRKLVGPRRKTVSLYLKTHGNPQTKPTGKLTKFFEKFFFKNPRVKTHKNPRGPARAVGFQLVRTREFPWVLTRGFPLCRWPTTNPWNDIVLWRWTIFGKILSITSVLHWSITYVVHLCITYGSLLT